jgi:hypothetical protein
VTLCLTLLALAAAPQHDSDATDDDDDSPSDNADIDHQAQFDSDTPDSPSSPTFNHWAAATAIATPDIIDLTVKCSRPSSPGTASPGAVPQHQAADKKQRGRPKAAAAPEAATGGIAAPEPAGGIRAARATRTRRATEKGAALQEALMETKRGRGRPRKAEQEEVVEVAKVSSMGWESQLYACKLCHAGKALSSFQLFTPATWLCCHSKLQQVTAN